MLELLKQIDTYLLLKANSWHNPFLDTIMEYASVKSTWIPFYIFIVILIIKKADQKTTPLLLVLLSMVLLILSEQLTSGFIQPFVQRLRPSNDPFISQNLHFVNTGMSSLYGFVSSFSANAFALTFYLYFTVRKQIPWLVTLIFPWAFFIAYSRIYVGLNYPSDVLSGALFGLMLAWAAGKIYREIHDLSQPCNPYYYY